MKVITTHPEGAQACTNQMSRQSIRQLLRHFTQNHKYHIISQMMLNEKSLGHIVWERGPESGQRLYVFHTS